MNKTDITMIDFRTWAENIVMLVQAHGTAREEIEKALEQSFSQGCALGRREGYEEGLNQGWAIEQDKQYSKEGEFK